MIKAEKLTKSFDSKKALNEVTISIPDGSIYGLVGSNGSGKSTLLRLISGIYMPDGGKITLDGMQVFNNPAVKSQIAYLGDTPYFLPHSTINEMAKFYRSVYPCFDNSLYNRLLTVFPLDYKARIANMSKGMQRQAALILTLSAAPRYLLLDEAFDGLDMVMRKTLKNILIEGADTRGMTTVIASHNPRELEYFCDRIGLIHNGNILLNSEIDFVKAKVHKVQAAFKTIPEKSAFSELNILKIERSGSVLQMAARGDKDEILKYINRLSPIFSECIEPTLEEVLTFELEANGYAAASI